MEERTSGGDDNEVFPQVTRERRRKRAFWRGRGAETAVFTGIYLHSASVKQSALGIGSALSPERTVATDARRREPRWLLQTPELTGWKVLNCRCQSVSVVLSCDVHIKENLSRDERRGDLGDNIPI